MNKFRDPLKEKISAIAEQIVGSHDAFLIDVTVRGPQQGRIVEIFIDNDSGVTSDLCASVSRQIGTRLNTEHIAPERYFLVVSSPGTDRPLRFLRQYRKHIGRNLSVKFREGGMSRKLEARLTGIADASIFIEEAGGAVREIQYNDIAEARVLTAL